MRRSAVAQAALAPKESTLSAGDNVYVNHPSASWVLGKIEKVTVNTSSASKDGRRSGFFYDVRTTDTERAANNEKGSSGELLANVEEWNLEVCDTSMADKTQDDLLSLTHLHDSTILRCLFLRYMKDIVYTNIGAIVVALNPFNFKIPHYMDDKITNYLSEHGQYISEKLLPHSWAQAHNTYVDMAMTKNDQCVLISGESGAGKTEATKIVMKYLSRISALQASGEVKAAAEQVLSNLIACSPVLECFGNARTVRNDNSSRFGKLMRVKFDSDSLVCQGAFTTKYLLEKSRIISAAPNERVYHSFYVAGRGNDAATLLCLNKKLEDYKSLFSGRCLDNSEFTSPKDYDEVCTCMKQLGMTTVDIQSVWRIAAAVIHQCNVLFSSVGEGSTVDQSATEELEHVALLWGIPHTLLMEEYISTTLIILGEKNRKLLPIHKAADVRDALSKGVYDSLFSMLVDRCNERCDVTCDGPWIALLDIFGFEDFETNSFEQLCINLTNETLQSHYNEYIFTKDIEQCRAEGIDVVDIKCPDNSPCLQLISGNKGILTVLDDQCSLGKGTDEGFFSAVVQAYDGKNPFFIKKKLARDSFIVKHYAGDVSYDTKGWLEKNRDTLKPVLKAALARSSDPIMAAMFSEFLDETIEGKKKSPTVGTFFKQQLQDLMTVINSTNPHWIRCVKPHPAKKPKHFGGQYTIVQLSSSGVLGTVKIRKAGYPVRWPHKRFCIHYQVVLPLPPNAKSLTAPDWKKQANCLLEKAGFADKKHCQVGATIVFMKAETYPQLEKKKQTAARLFVQLIQACGRGFFKREKVFLLGKALWLQKVGRGCLGRAQMFGLYCDKHRERILAERAERERQRKAEEERQKQLRYFFNEEISARQRILDEYEEAEESARLELQLIFRLIEEAERAKKLAEAKALEEERIRKEREEFLRRVGKMLIPLMAEEQTDREEVTQEEANVRRIILEIKAADAKKITHTAQRRRLEREEAATRGVIERESQERRQYFWARHSDLKRKHRVYQVVSDLNSSLEANRRIRARQEEERLARVVSVPRTTPERILVPNVAACLPLNSLPNAEIESNHSASKSQTSLSTTTQVDPKQLSPVYLAHRLAEHDAMTRKQLVQESVGAAGKKTSLSEFFSNAEGYRVKHVELGQRVYCPERCQSGVVASILPNSSRRQMVQLKLEVTGECVWMETEELRVRKGEDDPISAIKEQKKSPKFSHSPNQPTSRPASIAALQKERDVRQQAFSSWQQRMQELEQY